MYFIDNRIIQIPDEFYNKLVEFIQEKYGSLRKFSNDLGYSVSYISSVLNGHKPLNFKLFYDISKLGFDYDLRKLYSNE